MWLALHERRDLLINAVRAELDDRGGCLSRGLEFEAALACLRVIPVRVYLSALRLVFGSAARLTTLERQGDARLPAVARLMLEGLRERGLFVTNVCVPLVNVRAATAASQEDEERAREQSAREDEQRGHGR